MLARMRRPSLSSLSLGSVALVALLVGASGCHTEVLTKSPHELAGVAACTAENLAACEEVLTQTIALGDDLRPIATAYAEARAARDEDAFAAAVRDARAKSAPALLALGASSKQAGKDAAGALPVFTLAPISAVGAAKREELLLAVAEAAGLDYLAVEEPDGSVTRVWGRDPLAPWMAGLTPVARGGARADVARDAAIERALRGAFAASQEMDYVAAAAAVDELERLIASAPPFDAETLRARVALSAIGLGAPRPIGEETPEAPEEPAPRADETAYYDLLRVKTDRTSAGAYKARRERLLAAAPEAVRPLYDRAWGTQDPTCAVLSPPAFEHRRDLGFLFLLSSALLPAGARDPQGRLPLSEWYPRYEKALALVEREKLEFWGVSNLVAERGGASSITPSGTEAYRKVTAIALKHGRALAALAKAQPGRVGLGQLGFFLSPAAYQDPALGAEMGELARMSAQGSLAGSTQAADILMAAFVGVVVSTNMPGPLQSEHLTALAGAFTEKLKTDISKQTGWWAAAAYGADFAYRAMTGLNPGAKGTVAEIARALETDPKIEQPSLAALTSALSRYAALAAEDSLGSPFVESDKTPLPGRAAARASMQKALRGLAEGGEPDAQALADLAELTDNAVATAAYRVAGGLREESTNGAKPAATKPSASKKGDKPAICSEPEETPADPKIVRSLGKLADLRKKVLSNKALRDGTDTFSKRARLVALLISDGIDVAQAESAPKKKKTAAKADKSTLEPDKLTSFTVERARAGKILAEALESYGLEAQWATGAASAYLLGRGFLAEGTAHFGGAGRADMLALVNTASLFFGEGKDRMRVGELLVGLAKAYTSPAPGSRLPGFLSAAKSLYEQGEVSQADMILVASVLVSALEKEPPSSEAVALAEAKGRPLAWLLSFMQSSLPDKQPDGAPRGAQPAPKSFKEGLARFVASECAVASSAAIADVAEYVRRFKAGDRDAARLGLDELLAKEERKLVVPHVSYVFRQQSDSRIVNVALDIDLAAPFVTGEGGFNVGMGFQTVHDDSFTLDASVSSQDDRRTRNGTARYYVHALATTAVYHFLAGDPERGERAAAKALGYLLNTSWLFAPNVTDPPGDFVHGATATFAILAQLAADSGRPLLSGALLSTVAGRFDRGSTRPEELPGLLDQLDGPMAGIAELEPVVTRAKKTMTLLGGGFTCVGPKHDQAFLMKPTCESYPQALSLRFADSLAALPELTPSKKGATCEDFGALDAFLVPASSGRYDPDKLSLAVDRMLSAKKPFEAAFLLARLRDPNHCSEAIVKDMRRAAEAVGSGNFRADLLTGIVNCDASSAPSALKDDLTALRDEIKQIGDPAREIDLGVFSAVMAVRKGDPQLASIVGKEPELLTRHRIAGRYLIPAILLDHLASALLEKPVALDAAQKDLALVCGPGAQKEVAPLCDAIEALRAPASSAKEKKRVAEETLLKMTGG